MKSKIWTIGLIIFLNVSCSNHSPNNNKLNGTWQLVSSEATVNGTTTSASMEGTKMIKIINDTHFAFLNHDLKGGKDSTAVFVAGGGTCKLKDSIYSEVLEYCNYRDWEGLTVDFKVQFNNDTLILSGHEVKEDIKVDQFIKEKYVRIGG